MVRRLAALLGAGAAAAVAYFLLAPSLPGGAPDALAAVVGALAVAVCVLAPLIGREDAVALLVFGGGAAFLAVALNASDVGAAATPVEALLGATAGLLFAIAFPVPAAVVAVPLLVGGIDLASALGAGADPVVVPGDDPSVLTLALPAWGGGMDVARIGLLDAVFLALYAAWAVRFSLRPRLTIPLMAAGLAAAAALSVAFDRAVPALPFLALALLLPAAKRVAHLVRAEG